MLDIIWVIWRILFNPVAGVDEINMILYRLDRIDEKLLRLIKNEK